MASLSSLASDSLTLSTHNIQDELVLYLPIHSNYGQIEHTAAFLSKYPSKIFLYEWNTAKEKITQYYKSQPWKNIEDISELSLSTLIENLHKKRQRKRKVVFLLTSSVNYTFGLAQKEFFGGVLKKFFPDVIQDVFSVGHCLYGCQSCGDREHKIPVYFTRFFLNQLPFSRDHVKQLIVHQKQAQHRTISVLLCPSVGLFSYLSSPGIVDTLIQAQKTLGNLLFMVKLHSFCTLENHPLSGISSIEQENVEILKKHFPVIDETQHTILPLLSEFDVILSDLDSSVTFESLYFPPKPRLAYFHPSQEISQDPEYLKHLQLFSTPEELSTLLAKLSSDFQGFPKSDGRSYFKAQYGEVDGHEVERIEALRKWKENSNQNIGAIPSATVESVKEEVVIAMKSHKFNIPVTAVDYLAVGLPVPDEIVRFDRFVKRHLPQLETIGLPKQLWMSTYEKLSNEIFDLEISLNFPMMKIQIDMNCCPKKMSILRVLCIWLITHGQLNIFMHAHN